MKNHITSTSDQAITKRDLENLRRDISNDFGKVLSDIMIQIEERFNKIDDKFNKVDVRFNQIENKFGEQDKMLNDKFDNKFKKLKRDLLDSNLQIAEGLKLSREERAALTYRQSLHSDQLENQAMRISVLEKVRQN